MSIEIKRIYEPASEADGLRVLVDRLWPRGVTKAEARLGEWLKDAAPSPALRTWFCHKEELVDQFSELYRSELAGNHKTEPLRRDTPAHRKRQQPRPPQDHESQETGNARQTRSSQQHEQASQPVGAVQPWRLQATQAMRPRTPWTAP